MSSMLTTLSAVVTAVAAGPATSCLKTPNQTGRKVIRRIRNLPGTSTVKLQGAARDPSTKQAPAAGSSAWTDIETITSASATVAEIVLPDFIRWNCTVLQAAQPNVVIDLEGVQ